ncbi:hypothetical protein BGZ65_004178 [Modicella reniformis]|uniref:Uncharacterized protein n=1 Tax=Modicella reniformis TaxID=1440133 RepID=A0A9P6IKD2_9FUNG|nr:hypothetical protein BGZ65_004178 [Modicella reniformis]
MDYSEQPEDQSLDASQQSVQSSDQVTAPAESAMPTPTESTESTPPTTQVDHSGLESLAPSSSPPVDDPSTPTPDQQQSLSQQPARSPAKPLPLQPLKRRPRRTGQPLHLLLQDCSKQASRKHIWLLQEAILHISGYLCKKTPEEITAIVSDKKALAADLRSYSNEFVLTSARDRVIGEVDEQGKELLQDVDPERDVIRQRFEDEPSVFKSYDDAIHDIRVDLYLDGIKPRKQEAEEGIEETAAKNAELNAVLQIWDTFHKRVEVEPRRAGRSSQSPYPGRGGRPIGPPGTRSHPYSSGRIPGSPSGPPSGPPPPPHGQPFAGPPSMSGSPFREPRSHSRGYPDRPPYRDEYYADRRDDYRRPDYDRPDYDRRDPRDMGMRPPGSGPVGRPDPRDMRDPRDFRDRPLPVGGRPDGPFGPGGNRYDDRRRDRPDISNAPPPRDSRHSAPNSAAASPLASHPSLPPKPQSSHYDAAPAAHLQHAATNLLYHQHYPPAHQLPPHMDPQSAQVGYGAYGHPQGYPIPGQADYSGYAYAGYGQDPASLAAQQQYAYSGWDMSANTAVTVGLQLQPFTSNQPGRHKAVPLPTDFMSGPSDAPRLSMPEPHEVLGTIRGVIIRDAHGNIGLSQYHFTQSTQ